MTTPAPRPEHADKSEAIGNGYEIRRHLVSYCYPNNGNVHNPTPHYAWLLYLDGKLVDSDSRRAPLLRAAQTDAYR